MRFSGRNDIRMTGKGQRTVLFPRSDINTVGNAACIHLRSLKAKWCQDTFKVILTTAILRCHGFAAYQFDCMAQCSRFRHGR